MDTQGRGARTRPMVDNVLQATQPKSPSPPPDTPTELERLRAEVNRLKAMVKKREVTPTPTTKPPSQHLTPAKRVFEPPPKQALTPPPLSPSSVRVKANAAVDQLLGGRQDTVTLLNVVLEPFYQNVITAEGAGLATLIFLMLLPHKQQHQRVLLVASNPTMATKILNYTFSGEVLSRDALRK